MGTTHEITRNLGGDRLGSGSKNNIKLHNYNRSNHDLSYAWRSSMNVGTLVPFIKKIEENGDGFSIDLQSIVKTIPTKGPLFGSYKLQLDVFECPMRLYNGLLHNNMQKIGMNMKQVKLPKVNLTTKVLDPSEYVFDINTSQISKTSLLCYLGMNGIIDYRGTFAEDHTATIKRKVQCVPLLAYWDIYKNYYANKQEEKGVVITKLSTTYTGTLRRIRKININSSVNTVLGNWSFEEPGSVPTGMTNPVGSYQAIDTTHATQRGPILDNNSLLIEVNGTIKNTVYFVIEGETDPVELNDVFPMGGFNQQGQIVTGYTASTYAGKLLIGVCYDGATTTAGETILTSFNLKNIDDARVAILQNTGLNNELVLNQDVNWLPYSATFEQDEEGFIVSKYSQAGLGIKTYQSDLLQNWLSTEWIDGENGINAITAVDTSSGSFQIDALNLANKVYNMLNRIAVSGGTYEDWQEAVFTANVNRRAETPVYKGGLAAEICFDEVISTAATEDKPLGTLAGRAVMPKEGIRGGHIEISCNEPGYIIGIVSITPRIDYSQGNDWDITELDTMDDLHKPALDGIGFEDLLQERAAWWGTYTDGTNTTKLAIGKTPAWINYMTAINKSFGDFAEENKCMWMTLNRQYEYDNEEPGIADMTSYIDPRKYNYVFADSSIEAQNFWVQIGMRISARRVMSAKILPNL